MNICQISTKNITAASDLSSCGQLERSFNCYGLLRQNFHARISYAS